MTCRVYSGLAHAKAFRSTESSRHNGLTVVPTVGRVRFPNLDRRRLTIR
jgi:hypothetical protein